MSELRFSAANWHYSEGPPPESLGTFGDWCRDIVNLVDYGPKTSAGPNGGWGAGVSLVGPPGPKGNPGSAGPAGTGFTPRGAWASGTNYAVNDVVTHQGATYRRKVAGAGTTAPPSDTANWELWAAKGDTGSPGAGVPSGGSAGQYIRRNADGSTSWESHAGQGGSAHANATTSAAGFMTGADKSKLDSLVPPQRVHTPPAFAEVTLNVTSIGWQPMLAAPEITVPALGEPPAGFRWLLDIEGGIRINPPVSNASVFLQIQFDRSSSGAGVEGGGTLFASSQGALPVFRYGAAPPATNRSFTVNFYMWTNATGSYGIRGGPYPACRAYLVAV